MRESHPGNGFFGWLGRQVGHIKKAVQHDVAAPEVAYRKEEVKEVDHPEKPGVKLRRTTIDEVIVQKQFTSTDEEGREQRAEGRNED